MNISQKNNKMLEDCGNKPIIKKGDKGAVKNLRPVAQLKFTANFSTFGAMCIYKLIFAHFLKFLTKKKHGFVKMKIRDGTHESGVNNCPGQLIRRRQKK